MTSTKSEKTSGTVDFFPNHFDIPKTSSADAETIEESQLIHALENPTPALPFKVEEPALAAIKNCQKI